MQSISFALSTLIPGEQNSFNVGRKSPQLTVGSRSSTGSEFQTDGPPTEKARRPIVLRRYRRTVRRCRLAERRCRLATSATGVQHSIKYLGALFSRHRRTMTASLYFTHSGTLLSQWSWSWSSVKWNFPKKVYHFIIINHLLRCDENLNV